jgi:putative alpha-1,2-mannosidase
VINAANNSESNLYVNTVTYDGKPYSHNWLSHSALQKGAVLNFNMAPQPNTKRGTAAADAPFSMSDSK